MNLSLYLMSIAWCILNVVEIVEAEIDGPIIPLVLLLDSFAQFYLDWLDSGRCPQCFHAPFLIFWHIVSLCLPRIVGEFSMDHFRVLVFVSLTESKACS